MPYLNLDPNYPEHPKTLRLQARLGEMADALPIRLWAYCARMHPLDGHLKGYSMAEIEAVLKWHGARGEAVKTLIELGFISKTKQGFKCHDWTDHQGHLGAFSRRGKAAASARWSKYASSMPKALQKTESSNAPTVPSVPTVPNLTKPTVPGQARTADGSGKLLAMPWQIRGDHYGKPIQDLPADYCEWALNNLTNIGPEYKIGLTIRISQKRSEMTTTQREAYK